MAAPLHAANAPSHVAGTEKPFIELNSHPLSHTVGPCGGKRAINLCAGQAALPQEILEKASREFLDTDGTGTSVAEMGYRTKAFHVVMERAEKAFRTYLNVPDTHEVHFFNGGATLQFSAIPLNLLVRVC
jgi:phosphoserine aminotransferase